MKTLGRWPTEIRKGAVPAHESETPAEPVEEEVGGLDSENVRICTREPELFDLRLEEPFNLLEVPPVTAVVGKDNKGPGPSAAPPAGPVPFAARTRLGT